MSSGKEMGSLDPWVDREAGTGVQSPWEPRVGEESHFSRSYHQGGEANQQGEQR